MAGSTLRKVLDLFSGTDVPLSLGYIAHSLGISPGKAESLLHFWIQRGKIEKIVEQVDCGSCGMNGSCPFISQLPTSYKLLEPHPGT